MTNSTSKPFGYSLHLDIYGVDKSLCDDISWGYDLLVDLTKFLNMTMQSPPYIFRSPDAYPEKVGLSGWVPLIESGISIHTLVPKEFVTLDIYSCGCVDEIATIDYLKTKMKFSKLESQFLLRGIEYFD